MWKPSGGRDRNRDGGGGERTRILKTTYITEASSIPVDTAGSGRISVADETCRPEEIDVFDAAVRFLQEDGQTPLRWARSWLSSSNPGLESVVALQPGCPAGG